MTFCWLVTSLPMYLKSIGLPTDHKYGHKYAYRQNTSAENRNVVLFCYADNSVCYNNKYYCRLVNLTQIYFNHIMTGGDSPLSPRLWSPPSPLRLWSP